MAVRRVLLGAVLFTALPSAGLLCAQDLSSLPFLSAISRVKLSEELPVGGIRFIDQNTSGDLLISNATALEALLFDANGQLKGALSAANCHPGINWTVLRAKFVLTEKIFAVNVTGPSYFFDAAGACLNAAHREFYPMHDFCSFSNGDRLYGISKRGATPTAEKMDESGKTILRSDPIPTRFPTIDTFVEHDSIICDDQSRRIFVVMASSATVYEYDQDLTYKGAVLHRFAGQKIPSADAKVDGPGGPLAGLRHVFGIGGTLMMLAGGLEHGRILMQHSLYPNYVIQVVDGSTTVHEQVSEMAVAGVGRSGNVLTVVDGQLDERGFLPNPTIGVYAVE